MSKHTKKAIVDSFMNLLKQKSLDKITVKDIIDAAEINRNTFYYHYVDIYDLLEKIFIEEEEIFLAQVNEEATLYEGYIRAATFLLDNHEAITHIYNSKSRHVLQRFLETTSRQLIGTYVEAVADGTKLSEKGMDFIVSFYTYGIIGAIIQWIEKDMPDYRDSLMKSIYEAFNATVEVLIQTYIDGHPEECQ